MFVPVIHKWCPNLNYFIHMLVWITQDVWNSVRYLYWPIEYSNSLPFLYQMQYYNLHNSSVHTVEIYNAPQEWKNKGPQFYLAVTIIVHLHYSKYLLKYLNNTYHMNSKPCGNEYLLRSRHLYQTVLFYEVPIKI